MLHTIHNDVLTVTASEQGAELQSICAADGTQYLWQGDACYWSDRALNLFPYVARLWRGQYTLDGQTYRMAIHGFAPGSRFALREKDAQRMAFELCDSDETYAQYPRRFIFRIIYALEGSTLHITFEAVNRDGRTMYFGLGGHPGFNVPLEAGRRFEDYRLRFASPCNPVRVGFSADCFVNGQDSAFPLEQDVMLALRHELFDDDAIVLRNMAREVTLEALGSARSVTVSFPDMPYLGVWHWPKKDAPYVCIEPWASLPSRQGETAAFEHQPDLIRLEPGKTYTNTWRITIR